MSRIVVSVQEERARWRDVESAWGGMVLDKVEKEGNNANLHFRFYLNEAHQVDSAICVNEMVSQISEGVVFIALSKGLCNANSVKNMVVRVRKLAAGQYVVKYNDASAGYPILGVFEIWHGMGQ